MTYGGRRRDSSRVGLETTPSATLRLDEKTTGAIFLGRRCATRKRKVDTYQRNTCL